MMYKSKSIYLTFMPYLTSLKKEERLKLGILFANMRKNVTHECEVRFYF